MFVLSVELDEPAGQFLQRAGGDERAIDERPAASLSRDLAPDDDFLVAGLKDRFDRRDLFAGTDEVARRPAPEQQPDRFNENGLAGPGLAGQHVEPGLELDVDRVDDGEPGDAKEPEHRMKGTPILT